MPFTGSLHSLRQHFRRLGSVRAISRQIRSSHGATAVHESSFTIQQLCRIDVVVDCVVVELVSRSRRSFACLHVERF